MLIPIILPSLLTGVGLLIANERYKHDPLTVDKGKVEQQYRDQIGLGEDFKFNAECFSNHQKTKSEQATDLTKVFKNEALASALKENKALKNGLSDALKESKPFSEARENFKQSVAAFNTLLQRVPEELRAEALISVMKAEMDYAIDTLTTQQTREVGLLVSELNDDGELSKLMRASKPSGLGMNDDEFKQARSSLLDDLDASHKEQLEKFEKSNQKSYTQLLDAAQKDMNGRMQFLAALSQYNDKMKEELRLLAAKHFEESPLRAGSGTSDRDENIAYVKLSDLKTIYSKTGKEIKQTKPGEFSLEFGAVLTLDPRKSNMMYAFLGNQIEHDLELMARAVKAGGSTDIEFDIDFNHPEICEERARQAYKAAIEAGFPAEKIKINIHGNEMKINDLYKGRVKELGTLKERAQQIQADKAGNFSTKPVDKEHGSFQEAKKLLESTRSDLLEKAATAAELKAKGDADKAREDEARRTCASEATGPTSRST